MENYEEAEARVRISQNRDRFGKLDQYMYFVDNNNNISRDAYFEYDQAVDQVANNFNLQNGRNYHAMFLLSNGLWVPAGKQFTMNNILNFHDTLFDNNEILEYNYVEEAEFAIHGIRVLEVGQQQQGGRKRRK